MNSLLLLFSNLTDMFHELLNAEKFVDVTLACEHNSLKCHKVRNASCGCYVVARLTISSILGGAFSMLIIFPKASHRESLQASDHHHAAGSCICRSPVHHRVCLSRRNRRIRSRVAGERKLRICYNMKEIPRAIVR